MHAAPTGFAPDSVPTPASPGAAARARAIAAARAGRLREAECELLAYLDGAPEDAEALADLAMALLQQNRLADAIVAADRALAAEPRSQVKFLKASIVSRIGRYDDAIALYESALAVEPGNARGQLTLGHVLKTVGRLPEAIAAYRRALEAAPHFGEAWWSLANLKTFRFSAAEVAAMQRSLQSAGLSADDHCQIHFALGKAREDQGDHAASFAHYAQGSRLKRRKESYAADDLTEFVRRSRALLTTDFFAARAGQGCEAPDPIFVVGLPRSGSTLIEQILASHSQVEGVQELSEVLMLAGRISTGEDGVPGRTLPDVLAALSADQLRELGETYMAQTQIYRLQSRAHFVDKLPNNFMHVGLIHLILPRAKIIDARRHPLGCGFSIFKQHFAHGHLFANDLTDIARYYADYVTLMAHFDAALPGRIHRVIYEEMVADPEREVRRLLSYCGLAFEPACLKHYENDRPVRTPSSEQVRQPIYTDAAEHWRRFDPWLGPLRAGLGGLAEAYPDLPRGAVSEG